MEAKISQTLSALGPLVSRANQRLRVRSNQKQPRVLMATGSFTTRITGRALRIDARQ